MCQLDFFSGDLATSHAWPLSWIRPLLLRKHCIKFNFCANCDNLRKLARTRANIHLNKRRQLNNILLYSFLARQKQHFSFAIFCCTRFTISKE